MITKISTDTTLLKSSDSVFFTTKEGISNNLSDAEQQLVAKGLGKDKKVIKLQNENGIKWVFVYKADQSTESFRKSGNVLLKKVAKEKIESLLINGEGLDSIQLHAFVEGFILSSYQFLKYFKEEDKIKKTLVISNITLLNSSINESDLLTIENTAKAVFWARDMVNEPVNFMNATELAHQITQKGSESGFKVEVLDKKQIESLKMGGLLAVNKGSIDPPTFTIAQWKPENAVNAKPYVLVGKGVMYDTGGLSLKPTAGSMDLMKSDMAGAAGVAASIYSIALNQLPVWVIALLPATDNRPDGNAYVPGDIIKMYNGLHVEVLNTDAEGRMILADALSYGDKYQPELIMDMATLTGSAAMAIGTHGAVFMGNAKDQYFNGLIASGELTHERLVRFPFWEDYGDAIKSKIADIKNLGGREGGAISAGKFLEHFTQSPYIHIDIAGPAYLTSEDSYRGNGGTGYGVRLLTDFFKKISEQANKN